MMGLRGRCAWCGEGRLLDGFLTLKPRCEIRRLDTSFADPADGPAFFVMTAVLALVACLSSIASTEKQVGP